MTSELLHPEVLAKSIHRAATNDFTPWFVSDILGYLVRRKHGKELDNFIDDEVELDWFMAMFDLGDMFSKDET